MLENNAEGQVSGNFSETPLGIGLYFNERKSDEENKQLIVGTLMKILNLLFNVFIVHISTLFLAYSLLVG